jgi:uroporphyrinogen decarboxylase
MWVKDGADPHGFVLYDDMGDQQRPLISPRQFDEFYAPVFGRLIEVAHELGCEFHLHSCGKIDPLIPALIDWGLDALELDSPHMIGFEDLKPFRGKIMLWGCINIQSTYVNGTPDECEQEVLAMIKNMGTQDGGYGAYIYPQPWHINAPKQNIRAFNRGLKKYGDYAKNADIWGR